jgi:cation transport regulator
VRDNLPAKAQTIWRKAFNSAEKQHPGDDERASKIAWSAVKKSFRKNKDGNWVKKMNEQYFIPFAEREEGWYLFFPLGTVYHWGRKIDFTEERAKEMAANFSDNDVPGYDLPINMLHEDELGVFGYIDDLRFANDELQWKPKWRPEKEEDVKDKGYKYCSPEVVFDGYQARDGKKFNNVAMGIALTPRPRLGRGTALFSEDGGWEFEEPEETAIWEIEGVSRTLRMLRFLKNTEGMEQVASDALEKMKAVAHKVIDVFDDKEEEGDDMSDFDAEKVSAAIAETASKSILERLSDILKKEEPTEPEDFSEQLAALQTELSELKEAKDAEIAEMAQAKSEAEARVQEYTDKLAEEERKRRLAEFEDQAKELNVPIEGFAETLMYFSDADDSEDKARYAQMVAVIEAMGNAEKTAALFGERGSNSATSQSPSEKLDALIAARIESHKEGYAEATAFVAREHPELYAEYSRTVVAEEK